MAMYDAKWFYNMTVRYERYIAYHGLSGLRGLLCAGELANVEKTHQMHDCDGAYHEPYDTGSYGFRPERQLEPKMLQSGFVT